jgi:hypothetical protein
LAGNQALATKADARREEGVEGRLVAGFFCTCNHLVVDITTCMLKDWNNTNALFWSHMYFKHAREESQQYEARKIVES